MLLGFFPGLRVQGLGLGFSCLAVWDLGVLGGCFGA